MFLPTREDMTDTLTGHGYLIDTRANGVYGIYTEESLLVGTLTENEDGDIVYGDFIANGEWFTASGDDVIEFLSNEAVRARETEKFNELLDKLHFGEAMTDDNESEDY